MIYNGDCLDIMPTLADKSVDMVLCDLPYGTTACRWDVVIPFEPLWEQYKRIIKDRGAIVLFGNQPFTTLLIASNLDGFKYCWQWDKKIPAGMSYARFRPMQQTEDIAVFTNDGGASVYHPQMIKRDKPIKSGGMVQSESAASIGYKALKKIYEEKQPVTLISFDKIRKGSLHPTQKPVALLEYLIKTYTNEGETVLDNCAGSFTTAIACMNTNRKYICIEKDKKYFEIGKNRIENHQPLLQAVNQ